VRGSPSQYRATPQRAPSRASEPHETNNVHTSGERASSALDYRDWERFPHFEFADRRPKARKERRSGEGASPAKLLARWQLARLIGKDLRKLRMLDHHRRVPLDCIKVPLLKRVARLRRREHLPCQNNRVPRVFRGYRILPGQAFVNP